MTGGLIQLVATGNQDLYLNDVSGINYYKMVYRRHTSFSKETLIQKFSQKIDFGGKATCILSKVGDLISDISLITTLPKIPSYTENNEGEFKFRKFAWVKKIGFALIKSIYIDIGGQKIDELYSDWINIWYELTGSKTSGFDKMIGNIKELTDFTDGKDEYTLYIPLNFWFCGNTGLAIPLMNLIYHDVKVTLELNDSEKLHLVSPTHSIELYNDIVNFKKYEFIEQTILNDKAFGIFMGFDSNTKRMYYTKISNTNFKGVSSASGGQTTENIINKINSDDYKIIGLDTKYEAYPEQNVYELKSNDFVENLSLKNTFLFVEYIYLDNEERLLFRKNSRNKYVIDYTKYSGEKEVSSNNVSIDVSLKNSCVELFWIAQLKYLNNYGFVGSSSQYFDAFNYTDSFIYDKNNKYKGNNNVETTELLFDNNNRLEKKDSFYYNWIQSYQNHSRSPNQGINIYSFALNPEKLQPSGLCNMSSIDKITLKMSLNKNINYSNSCLIRIYSLNKNILIIEDGKGSLEYVP